MQTFFCVAKLMGCLQSEKKNQKSLCVSWFFIGRGIMCNCSAAVTVCGSLGSYTALPGRKAEPAVVSSVFQSSAGN